MFYIPSISQTGVSIDLIFDSDSMMSDAKLKNIKYEGQEILIKEEIDSILGISIDDSYVNLRFKKLKKRISKEMLIPENKLNIATNIPISDEQIVKYPDDFKIMK